MPTDVIMPALGMAQDTGKVVRWLKSEGDAVAKGEPLVEVETDKVTVEVEAPAEGTLGAVRAAEGDEVPVGEVVAVVLAADEAAPPAEREPAAAAAPAPAGAAAAPAPAGAAAADGPTPTNTSNRLLLDSASSAPTTSAAGTVEDGPRRRDARRPLASPKARKLAAARGIDLATVAGSGPHGAVVAADLEAAAPVPAQAPAEIEVGTIWRRMAERTTASWQEVPHFYLERTVDAGRLQAWRQSTRSRPGYERLSHTDLLVKLAAAALVRHPRVGASWRKDGLAAAAGVDIGIAVAVDDGLVVPVVRRADRLSLREIAERRAELVEAARAGRLRPDDVGGGTFTISNLGMYGVDAFHAIVNAPQAAILAVGRIVDRVVPIDGVPAVRPSLTLTLSFDHRVVDGARGAEFLDTLAGLVEEPAGLVD